MAGRHAADRAAGRRVRAWPRETALGSLCRYVSGADASPYQPANLTFDLLPPVEEGERRRLPRDKQARRAAVCRRAREALEAYLAEEHA
jgi:methylenetetrahydrofolate--tRNA-(uracil-5-)-methyltransferase